MKFAKHSQTHCFGGLIFRWISFRFFFHVNEVVEDVQDNGWSQQAAISTSNPLLIKSLCGCKQINYALVDQSDLGHLHISIVN